MHQELKNVFYLSAKAQLLGPERKYGLRYIGGGFLSITAFLVFDFYSCVIRKSLIPIVIYGIVSF